MAYIYESARDKRLKRQYAFDTWYAEEFQFPEELEGYGEEIHEIAKKAWNEAINHASKMVFGDKDLEGESEMSSALTDLFT